MAESGHSHSGVHVLQWRHGCEGEQSSDGSLTVLNSINEFGYDGEDLIQFNCTSKTWITPEENREREEKKIREREEENREREEKWSKIFNAVRKCDQCEEMLKMYLKYKTTEQYRTTDIAGSQTPPAVHMFAKKSLRDSSDLTLTCLITGFYPKDVTMSLRKFTTSFPDHLITSSGVRPNDDGTYQLRKSVEISGDDSADFNCYVTHSSLTEPVIKQWDGRCTDCPDNISHGLFIRVVLSGLVVLLWSVMPYLLIVKTRLRKREADLRKVFKQIWNSGEKRVNYLDIVYLRLIIGVSVSGVLAELVFLILCVVVIIKIATCPDCTDHISQGLMIGGVVSGMLVLLCPVILCMLIRKIIKYERWTDFLHNIYWDLIIRVVGLVLILYSVTLGVLIWRIIKYGRMIDHLTNIYWGLMIGVVVLVLILYSVILGVLIKIIKKKDNSSNQEETDVDPAANHPADLSN
ncbi:hypothetical protein AMEX_G4224 [Astyanax mexicanus]|uniref:Ig-like domain-containing protein n=1 Tax=Astyanax mexicanus TaxID=7994 RepID=A0A8T2MDK5_ASTMX|nr:hypothetical protein AMEX_G4224 [Astyanax mexicanus]